MTTERSGMSLDEALSSVEVRNEMRGDSGRYPNGEGWGHCYGVDGFWIPKKAWETIRYHLSRDAVVVIPDAMMVNLGEGTVMGEYSSNGDIVTGWNAYRKAMLAQRDGGNHGT